MTVLVCSVLPLWSGGSQRWGGPAFSTMVDAYCDRGHRVILLTCAAESSGYRRSNLEVHVVGGGLKSLPNRLVFNLARYLVLFPMAALAAYLRVRRRERIDLVYGYEVEGSIAGAVIRLMSRKPLVTRFQGTILAPVVLGPGPGSWRQSLSFLLHILAFKISAAATFITDDGTRGLEVMRQLNPAQVARTRFWRNGVDRATGAESAPHVADPSMRPDTELRLLTVSRLVGWKRLDRAIRAMRLVVERVPNAVLVVVGDGPELPKLKALAVDVGVGTSVRFEGHVPHAQVGRYYRESDIFVSLYDLSNLGNPLLEAMRHGRAIVTLNNGDTGTVVTDGVTGILLDQGEPDEVSRAVITLAEDPVLRARLGANAREFAETSLWTWTERMQAELDVVEALAR